MLAARPSLASELLPEHHRLLHRAAEEDDVPALEAMLACGFAVEARDGDGVTPLHRAAMAGRRAATAVLLTAGADVHATDPTFNATPLLWAAEGRDHAAPGADHVAVARLLIEAGSPVDWQAPDGAPHQEHTHDALQALAREAALSS
ncbi:ankyrin repeat domain-containing protein [Luteitalea sp. TBR-22]|uniref:ankyrin repeat domain-containing protein n=1 Tax=Luteitalea sp. TBR-22 TaxID=2802971 RepID=UPI00351CE514